jgi:UDP-N-acetylmuramate: L-alanyl-gamma-D-glutamyl-meso-diaminopimelate ligase
VVVEANNDALQRVMKQGLYCSADTFGVADADWQAHGNDSRFDVFHQGTQVGTVDWKLTGTHNQRNALACIAAANHIGISAATACEALGRFENVRRRMELRGTVSTPTGDIHVIDDFAHHPTAIKTTVLGLRQQLERTGTAARILAVFEPRSNTMKTGAVKDLLPASLSDVEMAFCFTQGLSWDAKAVLAPLGERAVCEDQIDVLVTQVCENAQPNDRILCMSNGGFSGVHDRLLTQLKKRFTPEA